MAKAASADAPKRVRKRRKEVATDLAVAMVLDKSGSMYGLTQAVIDGFNDYVKGLREQEGETFFSLTLFDTDFKQPYIGVSLDKVEPLSDDLYRPGGNTALYDAIAFTVKDLERRLKRKGRDDMKVLVVTLTDGCENSSTDFTAASLAALVSEYEAKGNYTFVYLGLGAQQREIVRSGALRGMGYVGDNAAYPAYSYSGVTSSFAGLASASATLRSSAERSSKDLLGESGIDLNDDSDLTAAQDVNASASPTKITAAQNTTGGRPYTESSLIDFLGGNTGGR